MISVVTNTADHSGDGRYTKGSGSLFTTGDAGNAGIGAGARRSTGARRQKWGTPAEREAARPAPQMYDMMGR